MSDSANASNYAPRLFGARPDREGLKRGDFKAAMERLFANGAIRIEEFKDGKREWHKRIARQS